MTTTQVANTEGATTSQATPVARPVSRGTLPDGTSYHVQAEPELREVVVDSDEPTNRVLYESFVVAPGCSVAAVACSETNAVQVVPLSSWEPSRRVWIESSAPRPDGDPTWLDPGPLKPRGGHDVHWTGTEMIVWGGADGDRQPHLVDGARFDPTTSTWTLMADSPFKAGDTTRSVWADDRLMVVSADDTYAYFPDSDSWERIGDGKTPSRWPGFLLSSDSGVVMWNASGVHRFEPASGSWLSLGQPPFGSDLTPWDGALRIDGDSVYAVGLAATCVGRRMVQHDGEDWTSLPPASLATPTYADCSFPNQTAVIAGQIVVWNNRDSPTKTLLDDEWVEIATMPLSGTEGAQGPVGLGGRFLVPQWGVATIFDPTAQLWTPVVDLPGSGSATDMIWTGEEVLMWGATCCYGGGGPFRIDAWRWTPPTAG